MVHTSGNIKRRRRKKHKNNRIWAVAALSAAVVLAAGGFLWFHVQGKEQESGKNPVKPKAVTKIKDDSSTDSGEEQKPQAQSGQEQSTGTDRSAFAVKPGEAVGSPNETGEKVVYLTLDDGPSENTPKVLEILDRYHVKATFFVTNINPSYSYLIKEAYDKGHTIGLHTYSHDYAAVYSSVDAYFNDLDAIGQMVKEQIGYVPCFIRFPGGSSNTISANYTSGIMSALAQEVQNRGFQYYDWNVSSGDGSVQPAEVLVANGISGENMNIMLLSHDANGKETTVEALPAIIEHYQTQGYVFKPLDKQSYAAHHGINN